MLVHAQEWRELPVGPVAAQALAPGLVARVTASSSRRARVDLQQTKKRRRIESGLRW